MVDLFGTPLLDTSPSTKGKKHLCPLLATWEAGGWKDNSRLCPFSNPWCQKGGSIGKGVFSERSISQRAWGFGHPNPNFMVRISSGGMGVFHARGWGPKSSVCPSKPRETKLFSGVSWDFCRDVPGAPEKFEKNSLCSIFGL